LYHHLSNVYFSVLKAADMSIFQMLDNTLFCSILEPRRISCLV
jgi:hypothetical protein